MRILRKVIIILIAILIVLFISVLVLSRTFSRKGLPRYDQDISLNGLSAPVKVYRDAYAIPHIYAGNESDLYMVTGYIMAQDRMWQMDLLRRVTTGRLSEIFGEDFIETDLFLRSLEFKRKSDQILLNSDTVLRNAVEAFARGVNLYIEDNKGKYPVEFTLLGYDPEPWQPFQTINLISYMAWDLKSGWSELILERIAEKVDTARLKDIMPDLAMQKTVVFSKEKKELLSDNMLLKIRNLDNMGLDIFSGSNEWAVSGERSVTGKPILANDMHLGFGLPGIWMQIHQVIEGKLNVTGLAVPGAPFIVAGHNDSIAWGLTNTYVDNLDFYEERISPADSNQYFYDGVWHKFRISEEIIHIKGGSKIQGNYRRNHRGAVVSNTKNIKDRIITLRWIGDEESNELRSIYLVNKANNWTEFKEAFSTFKAISQNIAYADVSGNIGLYACAGVPVRQRDTMYTVLPGWASEYEWKGLVPFEELPFEYNPARGYVSAANNKTAGDDYPYHIGIWYSLPYRIDRIREMLDGKDSFSIEDFREMQNDQKSRFSELFVKRLLPGLQKTENLNATEKKAVELMSVWDFKLTSSSPQALISEYWSAFLCESVFRDELGDQLFNDFTSISALARNGIHRLITTGSLEWLDNIETDANETLDDIALSSFRQTIVYLEESFGTDPAKWQWGKAHAITLQHPLGKVKILDVLLRLNKGPYITGGSSHTVSPYSYPFLKPDKVFHGSSHRNIYDLSNWDNSISVIPAGNSGICGSRHYADQVRLYLNGDYHTDFFSADVVKSNARYSMTFIPE